MTVVGRFFFLPIFRLTLFFSAIVSALISGTEQVYTQSGAGSGYNASNYIESITGTHTVDGNVTVDDVAGAGVAHGHIVSLAALQTGPITEQVLNLQAGGFI